VEALGALGLDPKFLLIQAVAFVLLLVVLTKFVFRPLLNILEARQANIRNDLDSAEARRVEMERLQKDYETRLAQIEDEARDKIQQAIKQAEGIRDEILAKARAESEQVLAAGREEIDRDRIRSMAQMRNEVADLAIHAAQTVVGKNLSSEGHDQLIAEALSSFQDNGHGSLN
jgi:F-type H+-transporting ATPase subunit b